MKRMLKKELNEIRKEDDQFKEESEILHRENKLLLEEKKERFNKVGKYIRTIHFNGEKVNVLDE